MIINETVTQDLTNYFKCTVILIRNYNTTIDLATQLFCTGLKFEITAKLL